MTRTLPAWIALATKEFDLSDDPKGFSPEYHMTRASALWQVSLLSRGTFKMLFGCFCKILQASALRFLPAPTLWAQIPEVRGVCMRWCNKPGQ